MLKRVKVNVTRPLWQLDRSCLYSTLCLNKNTPDVFRCNSRRRCWILIIFGRKRAIGGWYIFPPYLISASALLAKLETRKSHLFTIILCSTLQDFNQSLLDYFNLVDSQHSNVWLSKSYNQWGSPLCCWGRDVIKKVNLRVLPPAVGLCSMHDAPVHCPAEGQNCQSQHVW